jgi:hypothetical protein
MATKKISRKGFGQVEPNHLSGIVTGQIYAQLPAQKKVVNGDTVVKAGIEILEQGQFAKYDYSEGEVNFSGDGEWLLVYNEETQHDERLKGVHKNFALKAEDFVETEMTPRLIKTNVGDIYTTNTFGANTSYNAEVEGIELTEGDKLTVGNDGYLKKAVAADKEFIWKVVKVYTMPDGQPGVKIQRIA